MAPTFYKLAHETGCHVSFAKKDETTNKYLINVNRINVL